jgi:SAM-dependent methyltransferase
MRDYAAYVSPSLLPLAATLLALAGIRDGETVVDLGCGAGLLTHPAAAAAGPGARVFGVDADAAALVYARTRRASAVCWVRADAARLPVRPGSVDKVLCGTPLRSLGDPAAVVVEAVRVLVPGGRLSLAAWESFGGDAEAAARDALGAPPEPDDLGALASGLRVGYDAAEEVTLPFAGGATYAAWRASFAPAAAPDAVAALAARLGDAPVVARGRVRYLTART